ncbi:hypothetical protein Pryu01_02549 [Paraliobacillus ryukyuensis]|uniref:Uncharacterized protein n=1 Tax=Paraliobacillus ryukyuensis TaxID=200904 RepID=A0A366EDZ4_9BACI|nr:hypothetical protein [Paraliobacillus ryukyuensis]RBO99704.1 hypothetical protein DES48_10329 [Paraliobacillus ryukyuensis]
MNPVSLFFLASFLAVFGGVFCYKRLMKRLENRIGQGDLTAEVLQKEQTSYFIQFSLVEVIPILLIILGFTQLESYVLSTTTQIVALVLLLALIGFAILQVIGSVKQLNQQMKQAKMDTTLIQSLGYVGIFIINSIPVISIIGLSLF